MTYKRLLHYWPLWKESTGDKWIPFTEDQWRGALMLDAQTQQFENSHRVVFDIWNIFICNQSDLHYIELSLIEKPCAGSRIFQELLKNSDLR